MRSTVAYVSWRKPEGWVIEFKLTARLSMKAETSQKLCTASPRWPWWTEPTGAHIGMGMLWGQGGNGDKILGGGFKSFQVGHVPLY